MHCYWPAAAVPSPVFIAQLGPAESRDVPAAHTGSVFSADQKGEPMQVVRICSPLCPLSPICSCCSKSTFVLFEDLLGVAVGRSLSPFQIDFHGIVCVLEKKEEREKERELATLALDFLLRVCSL